MNPQSNPTNQNKFSKYSFLVIVFISILMLSYVIKNPLSSDEKKYGYSEFWSKLQSKQVAQVTIINHENKLRGKFVGGEKFSVDMPVEDKDLMPALRAANVPFSVENPGMKENAMQFFAVIVVPIIVIFAIWFLIMRQAQAGGSQAMSFGRSRAKMLTDNLPRVTFADVAGVDEAVGELQEVVEFLKDPKRFQDIGARIPRGILLLGPPGTGKTLMARAIAGEAQVPFFHMSGSDFVEMFVGVGASRVRDLFEQAKRNAPCLVFIDEMDAVGRQRGAGLGGGHDEREQTLNQLLVEMDGFDPNLGVIVIAATNRPDVLDPALLRPGRFDRQVVVDRPDLNGRRAILDIHARNKPLDPSIDLEIVARGTPGFTGADLSNVLNEAAILAARNRLTLIKQSHIEEAIERTVAGPERRSRIMSEEDKKHTAYHEAGHALVAKLIPGTDPVHKISILPRGMALGYTLQLPLEDKFTVTRTQLMNEITVLLGGRMAEQLVYGDISTGAANDIERSTKIARRMVMEFGMSDELGPLSFGHKNGAVFLGRDIARERDFSEEIAARIDSEVREIIEVCYRKAEKLIEENRDRLELVTQELIAHETLNGVRLETLLSGQKLPEEEISQREEKKRKDDEERNRLRREKKEADLLVNQTGDQPDKSAAAVQTPAQDAKPDSPAMAEQALNSDDASASAPISTAGGMVSHFYNTLDRTFRDIIGPVQNDNVRGQLEKIEKVILESKNDFAGMLLKQIIREAEDKTLEAGFRIRLAMFYAASGRVERVSDELLTALLAGSDRIEQTSKQTLVKAIGYFRILSDELRKSRIPFSQALSNSSVIERIDSRYREWEMKNGTPGDSVPQIEI